MEFGYAYERTGGNILELDDMYNTALKLTSYNAVYYYLMTRTKHGYTSILTLGPIPFEGEYIGKYSSVMYKKIESKSKNIKIEIDKFINDNKKAVQLVEEIEPEELYSACSKWNLLDYINREER